MPVIDDIKDSHSHLKGKGFKYKFSYFWEYYRIPTLIGALVLIFFISIIKTIVSSKDMAFQAIMINATEKPDENAFAEYVGIDTEEYEVFFDNGYYMSADPEAVDQGTYTNAQKIMAVVSAASADIAIGDPALIQNYINNNLFGDLRDYIDQDTLDSFGDKVIWYQPTDDETGEPIGDEMPVAIDVADAKKLVDSGSFYFDSVYFAIIVNTKHPEYCAKYLEWIYEQ